MNKLEIILTSKEKSKEFSRAVSEKLRIGDVLALYGELGAGKTFFTQNLCSFLNVKDYVNSPSYVLMNEYFGDFCIYHFDLYRLNEFEEVLELGLEEIIHQGITIIEWPEIAEEFLPEKTIKIYLSYYKDCRKAIIYAKKDIIENIKKILL
jgi:tRNA threonylcarbamoyladenosine biosynthesis protein TsaE